MLPYGDAIAPASVALNATVTCFESEPRQERKGLMKGVLETETEWAAGGGGRGGATRGQR